MKRIASIVMLLCLACGCTSEQIPSASYSGFQEEPDLAEPVSELDASLAEESLSYAETIIQGWKEEEAIIQEILKPLGEDGYVTYDFGMEPAKNIHLLEDWIEAFRTGEPAEVYLYYYSWGWGNSLYRLQCDGSAQYTITDMVFGDSAESQIVLKRAVDYVFLTDLPATIRMDKWQALLVKHTPITLEYLDYDLEMAPSLGEIGPQEACELARLRIGQFAANAEQAGIQNFFGGGQWFPLDFEMHSRYAEYDFVLEGAVRLADHLCYQVVLEVDGVPNDFYAVSGQGLVFSDHRLVATDGFSLFADPYQELIMGKI